MVWKFVGPLTGANLNDDDKFLIIEMSGPTDNAPLTDMTQSPGEEAWGCFTNPAITYVQRLKILGAAKALVARGVAWVPFNALLPKTWDGKLNTITHLRCDGLVEVCYEINGVEVWGMVRTPDNNTVHYDICDLADDWSYNELTGEWTEESNEEPDNLEEHNDYDNGDFSDTLMPATQCGHETPVDADTRFQQQDLCIPVGSKGGN